MRYITHSVCLRRHILIPNDGYSSAKIGDNRIKVIRKPLTLKAIGFSANGLHILDIKKEK